MLGYKGKVKQRKSRSMLLTSSRQAECVVCGVGWLVDWLVSSGHARLLTPSARERTTTQNINDMHTQKLYNKIVHTYTQCYTHKYQIDYITLKKTIKFITYLHELWTWTIFYWQSSYFRYNCQMFQKPNQFYFSSVTWNSQFLFMWIFL